MDKAALKDELAYLRKRIKEVKHLLQSDPDRPKERCLYVLECKDGHYYVGQTTNIKRRFVKHQNGSACWFTKAHPPIRILKTVSLGMVTQSQAAAKETELTYEYVQDYGYHKVRGGAFIQRDPHHFMNLLNRYSPIIEVAADLDRQMLDAIARDK